MCIDIRIIIIMTARTGADVIYFFILFYLLSIHRSSYDITPCNSISKKFSYHGNVDRIRKFKLNYKITSLHRI
jgi:hypothetical protein